MQTSPDQEIERYLRSGEQDHMFSSWPGSQLAVGGIDLITRNIGNIVGLARGQTFHAVLQRDQFLGSRVRFPRRH